jgi:manganese/zinc/iron transport system permease protein
MSVSGASAKVRHEPAATHRWDAGGTLSRVVLVGLLLSQAPAAAPAGAGTGLVPGSSSGHSTWRELAKVLTLRDYNTRVVMLGAGTLGLGAGLIGSFMLLRGRALLGDALSHATLPGIGVAFLVMTAFGATGKSLPGLLVGATISGLLGVGFILLVVHLTRIKEDAALGIVLSVFFGLGVGVTGIIQNLASGHAAGLQAFIYGKTASMLLSDALAIVVAGAVVAAVCLALFKELTLLCFDPSFARAQGWPVLVLDIVLMAMVVAITVIGLQAVGLILMVALLVIPPAAARFWTHHLPSMLTVAAALGAVSCLLGAGLSAVVPRLPAGAVIVVVCGVLFVGSLVFGGARGVLRRLIEQRRLAAKVGRQHLLRAMYELSETGRGTAGATAEGAVPFTDLLRQRSWSAGRLRHLVRRAQRGGLVTQAGDALTLTPAGQQAAWRVTRNHRLWELYLITHADIAPSHVDRDADEVEHVLPPELIGRLESLLSDQYPGLSSPHRLNHGLPSGQTQGGP